MTDQRKNIFTLNGTVPWVNLAVVLALLYFGRPLLVPMSFGLLLAIIAYPACKWMESKRIPRSVSSSVLILGITLLFLVLLLLLGIEISMLSEKKEDILQRLGSLLGDFQHWLQNAAGVEIQEQESIAEGLAVDLESNLGGILNRFFSAAGSAIVSLILIPLFGVLFLLHRDTFIRFIESVTGTKYSTEVRKILHESILSYFRFVKGTFFVYCIVGVLNSIGLLLLGIEHAVLFGIIAAFMTIIPYVGIIISAALPVSVALLTKDSLWYPAGVIGVFSLVQYLEANVIYPRVVGGQLNLSTWAVLVTIIVGTLLWGIAGMILFVPFLGILKIVSDHVSELKPLNILISRSSAK